jgi:integrase
MRGDGRIFQKKGSRFWHMAYYVDGREVSESTKEIAEERARRVLRKRLEEARRGEVVPHESRLTVEDLVQLLLTDYEVKQRRSLATVRYPLRHVVDYFGPHTKAVAITGDRVQRYIHARRRDGAATATINMEVALLCRAFTLAIKARRLAPHRRPQVDRLPADETRVRRGFFSREQMEALAARLPDVLGDLIRFLFFSAWRVGEVRTLEWRDYDRNEGVIRLRPERSKNRYGRVVPVDRGELAAIIARRWQARRLDCPYVFHRNGRRVGDFRKLWAKVCAELGLTGRIVHDLRRSGVRHLIRGGTPPHTVMAFSGHRTASMLKRYDIIDVDDLRRAAERASAYQGESATVHPLRDTKAGEKTDRTPATDHRS